VWIWHVRHTLALTCAKNHLLIFSSFLDIWENVEWPRFFGPPCILFVLNNFINSLLIAKSLCKGMVFSIPTISYSHYVIPISFLEVNILYIVSRVFIPALLPQTRCHCPLILIPTKSNIILFTKLTITSVAFLHCVVHTKTEMSCLCFEVKRWKVKVATRGVARNLIGVGINGSRRQNNHIKKFKVDWFGGGYIYMYRYTPVATPLVATGQDLAYNSINSTLERQR